MNLGKQIVKLIDTNAIEKDQPLLIVNSEVMDVSCEPYQHHWRNITANSIGKVIDKYVKRTLEVNNISLDS